MKKLLATFAVTTLLVILAVSAVSCVYRPDADKVIDIDVLGEPIFADEFDTFDTDTWWSGEGGSGNPANPETSSPGAARSRPTREEKILSRSSSSTMSAAMMWTKYLL